MNDCLHITGLRVSTRIGIHAWEQHIQQPLVIDIKIPIDTTRVNEHLHNTVDYSTVCAYIAEFVENKCFGLLETLANELANGLHQRFNIQTLSLSVGKPTAIPQAATVTIHINREYP